MNELKATRGPWLREGNTVYTLHQLSHVESNRWSAQVCGYLGCPEQEVSANAALIAAAPELDKELQAMCALWLSVCNAQGWAPYHAVQYGDALAALKKARGE